MASIRQLLPIPDDIISGVHIPVQKAELLNRIVVPGIAGTVEASKCVVAGSTTTSPAMGGFRNLSCSNINASSNISSSSISTATGYSLNSPGLIFSAAKINGTVNGAAIDTAVSSGSAAKVPSSAAVKAAVDSNIQLNVTAATNKIKNNDTVGSMSKLYIYNNGSTLNISFNSLVLEDSINLKNIVIYNTVSHSLSINTVASISTNGRSWNPGTKMWAYIWAVSDGQGSIRFICSNLPTSSGVQTQLNTHGLSAYIYHSRIGLTYIYDISTGSMRTYPFIQNNKKVVYIADPAKAGIYVGVTGGIWNSVIPIPGNPMGLNIKSLSVIVKKSSLVNCNHIGVKGLSRVMKAAQEVPGGTYNYRNISATVEVAPSSNLQFYSANDNTFSITITGYTIA
jgi:hypothetical protein